MKNIKLAVLSAILLAGVSCKKEDTKAVVANETQTENPVSNQKIVSISGVLQRSLQPLAMRKRSLGLMLQVPIRRV